MLSHRHGSAAKKPKREGLESRRVAPYSLTWRASWVAAVPLRMGTSGAVRENMVVLVEEESIRASL